MQKTEQYQLNLIETTDPISPDPINENTRAVETRLQAQDAQLQAQDGRLGTLESGLSAETQARTGGEAALRAEFQGADTALKTELQKADAALRSELQGADSAMEKRLTDADAALKAELQKADTAMEQRLNAAVSGGDTALDAKVTQARNENALVHLAGPVDNSVARGTFRLDLSHVDMSKYRALFIMTSAPPTFINDTLTVGTLSVTLASTTFLWLYNTVYGVSVFGIAQPVSGSTLSSVATVSGSVAWNSIRSLEFTKNILFADVYGYKA